MFQRFVEFCVTNVSKVAVLTEVVLMFSECLSVLSNSVLPICRSKVAVLTEVVFVFYVCISVFSDSVLPMGQKLLY